MGQVRYDISLTLVLWKFISSNIKNLISIKIIFVFLSHLNMRWSTLLAWKKYFQWGSRSATRCGWISPSIYTDKIYYIEWNSRRIVSNHSKWIFLFTYGNFRVLFHYNASTAVTKLYSMLIVWFIIHAWHIVKVYVYTLYNSLQYELRLLTVIYKNK